MKMYIIIERKKIINKNNTLSGGGEDEEMATALHCISSFFRLWWRGLCEKPSLFHSLLVL